MKIRMLAHFLGIMTVAAGRHSVHSSAVPGYGLRDIHVRHTLKQLELYLKHFAIVKSVSPMDLVMWQKLGINAYSLMIKDFIELFREHCLTADTIKVQQLVGPERG